MKQLPHILIGLLLCSLPACHRKGEQPASELALLARFSPTAMPDTLHLELPDANATETPGDTLPNALFFMSLDTAWLREIEHVADSTEAVVFGKGRYSLSDQYDVCLVDIRQSWFRHYSLLVYDKQRHAFSDRVTVAEWYGGEGGQVLTSSWLFDFDGDGKKDLVRREIEHWLLMREDEEPLDTTVERASLLLWKDGHFVTSPTADSAMLVKRFPIKS